jgi:hypothetical protein
MSVSNLNNAIVVTCTANNTAVLSVSLPFPLDVSQKVKVVAPSTSTGANALALNSVNNIAAYNAATPTGFSIGVDKFTLLFKGGAVDTSVYILNVNTIPAVTYAMA